MSKIQQIIQFLQLQLGHPYKWNEKDGDPGWDCSGLTKAAYAVGGIDLPDGSYNQEKLGRAIPVETARMQPSCLIFKRNNHNGQVHHVACVVDKGDLIEAGSRFSRTIAGVTYSPGVIRRPFDYREWDEAKKHDILFEEEQP